MEETKRVRKIHVIFCDPDATDSSSSDDDEGMRWYGLGSKEGIRTTNDVTGPCMEGGQLFADLLCPEHPLVWKHGGRTLVLIQQHFTKMRELWTSSCSSGHPFNNCYSNNYILQRQKGYFMWSLQQSWLRWWFHEHVR